MVKVEIEIPDGKYCFKYGSKEDYMEACVLLEQGCECADYCSCIDYCRLFDEDVLKTEAFAVVKHLDCPSLKN
ncbi:hypothetical protein LCGC14_0902470 [marine sediment metagenome]|uniref:Uncharacterized protein n=1 Tax=marine sediment metagenome TaxID=412755 RepID=A0A0F9S2X0_9ZZZZ